MEHGETLNVAEEGTNLVECERAALYGLSQIQAFQIAQLLYVGALGGNDLVNNSSSSLCKS